MPNSRAVGGVASLRPAVVGMARVVSMTLSSATAAPLSIETTHPRDEKSTPMWIMGVASMALVLLGGAFAGLTIAWVPPQPIRVVAQELYVANNVAIG